MTTNKSSFLDLTMSVFDRDAKLAKAAYIFREQERKNSERKETFDRCKEKIQSEFLNHLPTQDKHEGQITQGKMFSWLDQHEDCKQFVNSEYSQLFPTETLEGKLSYDYYRYSFFWKLKK